MGRMLHVSHSLLDVMHLHGHFVVTGFVMAEGEVPTDPSFGGLMTRFLSKSRLSGDDDQRKAGYENFEGSHRHCYSDRAM